jgi:adenosylcobinamide-GDP ribazoletransferase
MDSFLLALQFLTIIPIKIKQLTKKTIANAITFFPLAGLLLGAVLAVADYLLGLFLAQQLFINVILVILLVVLTGGIHLDGLADSADALFSNKNKVEMLSIMRDSHIGVMGALSLICIILLKVALLSSIKSVPLANSLILTCVLSRWSMVLAIFLFPYTRKEGRAKEFKEGINLKIFIQATVITIICALVIRGFWGLLFTALVAVFVYSMGRFTSDKIGGITGDTLGAINELTEVVTLFGLCLL